MNACRLFILALVIVAASGCQRHDAGNGATEPQQSYESYLAILNAIKSLSRSLSDVGDWPYFENHEVRRLYPVSHETHGLTMALLKDPGVSTETKRLAFRLQQCLTLPEYVRFVEVGYGMVKEGELPWEVLGTMINPGAEWGVTLSTSFKDPSVAEVLQLISSDSQLPERLRETAVSVMNGDVASYIAAYQAEGEPFPSLRCESSGLP